MTAVMTAPHTLKSLKRAGFMSWLEGRPATLSDVTNPYEVVRYRMWVKEDKARPSTHIIYKRANGSLTYTGCAKSHYEEFCADRGKAS